MVQKGSKLIRVGFVLSAVDSAWLGGLNYFRNLLKASSSLHGRQFEEVILAGRRGDKKVFQDFPPLQILRSTLFDRYSAAWLVRKIAELWFGRDLMLERFLKNQKIALLSHSPPLGPGSLVPTIGWIPDFQHRRLPEFFSEKERHQRDKYLLRLCQYSTCLLLSSYEARNDLEEFSASAAARAKVLHFVVDPGPTDALPNKAALAARYAFTGDFFHLPNQFWAHKNHRIAIEALAILQRQGCKVLILSTGNTKDSRHPEFFNSLMRSAEEAGVSEYFKVLGIVPYSDLIALMVHSLAVINPSLFEGWSTTVEEAKSLGKRILLSDIAVHREQDPEGGIYFDPKDPKSLAEAILRSTTKPDPTKAESLRTTAQDTLGKRVRAFAGEYNTILSDVLGLNRESPGEKEIFPVEKAGSHS